jgi:hypothetical protein
VTTRMSLVLIGSMLLAACGDDPSTLNGRHSSSPSGDPNAVDPASTPEALQCTDKPQGRSYLNFDGNALEASRVNENVGVNRARQKPYAVMAGEYQRVLGVVPDALAGAAGSFDAPPPRWFAEAQYSGVSLNAIFDISFQGCQSFTKTAPEFASAPTTATATTECTTLMRKAWSRAPSPAEIQACVDLATTALATEPDPRKQWTYVCASVLSSSQFLTF